MTAYPGWQNDQGYDPDDYSEPPSEPDELAYIDVALSACDLLVRYSEATKQRRFKKRALDLLEEAIAKAKLANELVKEADEKQRELWQAQQDYRPEF